MTKGWHSSTINHRGVVKPSECRLGFLALDRWSKALALGKQLAVYCLGGAVSSLVCLIINFSTAVVAYTSDRDLKNGL